MKKLKTKKKFNQCSKKQFDQFRNFFPFSCVDIILPIENAILLTKRTIPPYKGKWHFPGGIVRKNEKMTDAVKRIAKLELNVDVKLDEFFGTYENLNRYRHDISHCFICHIKKAEVPPNFQSSTIQLFVRSPANIIPYHSKIMREAQSYLKSF